MTRREDPQGFDASPLRNGWALPQIARVGIVGVLCFLLLFLLGAVPYLPSPVLVLQAQMREHMDSNATLLRAICREVAREQIPSECR